MSDTDTFKRSLREAWQDISKPQTHEVYDDLIEHFLLLFSHQARGGRRSLQALLSQSVTNIPSHKSHRLIFRKLGIGIVAWYESDFDKSSKVFGELAVRLGTYRSPPGGLDPFITFTLRLHLLIWTAASECRLGHFDKSQETLDEVRLELKSRKDFRCPNCLGWYHAERGRTCFWSDDTARANYHYTRAIDIFRQTKNRFGLAEAANACARLSKI